MDAEADGRGRAARSVLLVEDEPGVLLVLAQALEDAGLSVSAAPGQGEAERLLAAGGQPFDVVVTDLALGDGDGGALIDAAAVRGLPSIGMTGHPDRWPAHGAAVGPRAMLAKPFRPERLVAEVQRVLGAGQPG